MRRQFFIILAILTIWVNRPAGAQPTDTENSLTPSALLAEEFIRIARMATMTEPLDLVAINAALALATEATLLTPDDPTAWSVLHEVAQMADRQEISRYARESLLRVSPLRPQAQLARLRDVVNTKQTVDERIILYEQLLSESRTQELDPRVAARLALDSAYLHQQLGDITQFARWLAESVALDPSYPDAITLATGFFGDESADVYSRVELLASAMLSNIRDMTTQVVLAEFLMAFGDYKDAKTLYEIILGDGASDPNIISDSLLADIVLSQWAAGDDVGAMKTLSDRQSAIDKTFRAQTKQQQPRLTPLELARIHAPLIPKLATIRAAVYANQFDTSQAAMALNAATSSLITVSKLYEESQGEKAIMNIVELYLHAAWIELWLGGDVDVAESLVTTTEKGVRIDPTEKQKLEGWIAFRRGDNSTAKSKLYSLKSDPSAKVGMALIYLTEGNKRNAALELLSVARDHGGTLIGVWSRNKLEEIVGTSFNIREEVAELQKFMVGVLQTMDTYLHDPRPPIGMKLIPIKNTFAPYQPVLVQIVITNNTTIPLTIASNGPILPLLLIEASIEIPGLKKTPKPPIIVAIDRELSIKPRGVTTIEIDLRNHWLGGILDSNPLKGASITLKGTVNFTAREVATRDGGKMLVYEPTRLGLRHTTDSIRVNGVRLSNLWLEQAIEQASEVEDVQNLIDFVLLTWTVGDNVSVHVEQPIISPPPGEEIPLLESGERHPLQDKAITTILSSFPGLHPIEQSWVLTKMSDDPSIEAVVGMLKKPETPQSQIAWIIRFATPNVPDEALDDPRLLEALNSDNEQVQKIATWVYAWAERVVKSRVEQLLGGGA